MEVEGPGDPWANDPGPLITPVDAGTAAGPLNNQLTIISIALELKLQRNLGIKISPWGLSRSEEQLPCVKEERNFFSFSFQEIYFRPTDKLNCTALILKGFQGSLIGALDNEERNRSKSYCGA